MNTTQRGFTLVELMIVVVIVAILASIAYPSYTQFVRRSARADAKAALLENAQFMERNFTAANRYDRNGAGDPIEDGSLPVQSSPREGTPKYAITVDVGAAAPSYVFTLSATPIAGSPAADDECGTLIIDQTGAKTVDDASLSAAECWNR